MRLLSSARFLLPAAAVTALLASGCGGGGSGSGPSKTTVRNATAADVVSVLNDHRVSFKGPISCYGQAPGIIDCTGTTSDGKQIQATLTASTSGKSCTGPMVVNIDKTQLASLPDEKCS